MAAQRTISLLAAAAALAAAAGAFAGSSTNNGLLTAATSETLRFQIAYPSFLRFRVGAAASVSQLTFDVPVGSLGNGTPVAATGGDAGPSSLTVSIVSNAGVITIGATNNSGGLGLGTGTPAHGYINYNQIATTSSTPDVPAPALTNSGVSTAVVATTSGPVTVRSATWTYAYANTSIPTSGVYGTAANGGRVTYTASSP